MRKSTGSIVLLLSFLLNLLAVAQSGQTYIWWEGEDYKSTNALEPLADVPGNNRPDQQAKLSGGKWMTPHKTADGGACTISYEIEVPKAGNYDLYVRKFWKHGPFKWRFNEDDWRECGKRIALLDSTFLQKHWGANWVSLGQLELAAGTHILDVEMIENKGCFDCWLLIEGPFDPRGKLKPDEKTGAADPGYFAWEPGVDTFLDDCPIDMSFLNKPINGFVKKDDNGFVDPDGDAIRFWMVQGGNLMSMERKTVDFWARRLAKYGVNLNRVQLSGLFKSYTSGDMDAFNRELDDLHYAVAALKKNGIYSYLGHLYWQTHVTVDEKVAGPGYGKGKKPLALLFFDPDFQAYYKRFVGALMNKPNPYTGLAMADDPAVAFVEIQNESSLLFWTFKPDSFVPQTRVQIEREFALWAEAKYSSLEEAMTEWGTAKAPKKGEADNISDKRLGLYDIGLLTGADWAVNQRNHKRASDQLRFMVEWQKAFYTKMVKALREEVGLKNMISCSNWKTADPRILGIFERYSYLPGDLICRNVYYGVEYQPNPERFYAVDAGDTFRGRSALKAPAKPSPLTVGHVDDHPYMITENNWTRPNRFRAEWPFLVATYARMMGVDGWNFFALDSSQWQTPMNVWELNSPCVLGQFPAASLIFRKGYVREADYAVTDVLNLDELYNFKGPYLYELTGQDDLWVSKIGDLESGADKKAEQVEPLAFFVGKVNRILTDGEAKLSTVDFAKYIDPAAKTVKSMTGELSWNYGDGVVTVNTPYAQGAAGFLGNEESIILGDIEIICDNEYAVILVVSLDGKPLAESAKILIQAATEDQPYGFRTRVKGDFETITELGGYPLNVKLIKAQVKFLRRQGDAQILDGNGYPTGQSAKSEKIGDGMRVTLPEDSLYTLIR